MERELAVAIEAVREAADVIMAVVSSAAVRTKGDGSYVTDADEAADRIIRARLGRAFPDDAILTEEGAYNPARLAARRCWIVDPLDGTSAFVAGSGDFDVYVALVEHGRPVVAVTLQPATGLLLHATAGGGAWIARPGTAAQPLRFASPAAPRIGSRGWLGAPANLPLLDRMAKRIDPNASAVFSNEGLGARSFIPPENKVDAIVGIAADGQPIDAWEWDIAAVDLIVREAGGASSDLRGRPLRFNRPHPRMNEGLVMVSDPVLHRRIVDGLWDR